MIFLEILSWKCDQSQFVRQSHTSRFCVCLLFLVVSHFLNSRRSRPKIIFAIFEHTCLLVILVIINKQIHPLERWKFSSFEDVQKKCATGWERFSKFAFPKCFRQWPHHEGMCSPLNWLLWMKQQFLMYKFLVCLYNPIIRFRGWFHF